MDATVRVPSTRHLQGSGAFCRSPLLQRGALVHRKYPMKSSDSVPFLFSHVCTAHDSAHVKDSIDEITGDLKQVTSGYVHMDPLGCFLQYFH